mgnify:CR=1 FL=1
MESIGNLWLYLAFFGIVTVMLLIDFLGFKQKEGQEVKIKTAAFRRITLWCRSLAVFTTNCRCYCGQYKGHGVFCRLFT